MIREIYLGNLVSNLINSTRYDFQQLQAFWGFGDEFKQLHQKLSAIADLVKGLEARHERSDEIRMKLREIDEVAYEADDLLSELAYETTRLQIQPKKVRRFCLNLKANIEDAGFHPEMGDKLKEMTKALQNVLNGDFFFPDEENLSVNSIQKRENTDRYRSAVEREADPVSGGSAVGSEAYLDSYIGREADTAKIVSMLKTFCYQHVTIVPIIGMAGIGKTALAELVILEARERELFDVIMWANATDDFDERRIFREMSMEKMMGFNTMNDIRERVGKELAGKRFLLVLDDVWDDVFAWWDHFKTWLLEVCADSGNAIIVTTRSYQVAFKVQASTQHWYTLDLLSDYECWSILEQMTSSPVRILLTIGKEIAKKCRGLPLVAVVLGSGLRNFNDESYWLTVRDSDAFNLAGYMDTVVPSFKLSFNHLPSFLKPCFVFCSIFPKGLSNYKGRVDSIVDG